jgi:hypothetical protein
MMKHIKKISVVISFLNIMSLSYARSIHRPSDPHMPEITVSWVDSDTQHSLQNYHLEEYALFKLFDKEYFESHLLPETVSYRYEPEKSVSKTILTPLIDSLIDEVKQKKRKFTHFTVLQDKDFNSKKSRGLIILKFNDYPFVLKLFMETPDSFVSPFDKGLEPIFFFFMAGGINRHLSGFTRIKNMEIITQRIARSKWKDLLVLPRKWYWLPKDSRWIQIAGRNIDGKKTCNTSLPGTYCIIADAMEAERNLSLMNAEDKKTAMELCNFLYLWIDPHITNFMIEKRSKKLVIVDTEHFPSFVGLKEQITFNSYTDWYWHMATKCFQNEFLQTKRDRRNPKKFSPLMAIA